MKEKETKRHRLTTEAKEEIAAMYADPQNKVQDIADRFGIGKGTVSSIGKAAGIDKRNREWRDEEKQRLMEASTAAEYEELAARYNVSVEVVRVMAYQLRRKQQQDNGTTQTES